MEIIKPFQGVRYDLKKAGDLSTLIAPPYDIINPELQADLGKRSPHNIIHLILRSGGLEKYAEAARLWREWRAQGVLKTDPAPRLYRYNMSFTLKLPEGIVTRERPGFVALLKLFEYKDGKVLPHERTLAGPKQDRFQLMLNTRAHLSQVFMLYPDKGGKVDAALSAAEPAEPALSCEDDAGVTHTIWPIEDADAIKAVQRHFKKTPVYIADGHHRYETALALRRHLLEKSPLFADGCDYVMTYFTPVEHPGLVVFPYHRLLHSLPKRRFNGLLKKLETNFKIEPALINPFEPGAPRREFMTGITERGESQTTFAMVDGMKRRAYYLSLKSESPLKERCDSEVEMIQACLDVVILEDLVLTGMLDIKHKDLVNEKYVSYETDYDRVFDAVDKGQSQMAILLNPTPVSDVLKIADKQGIMPEKSTYFFPKLASGLVMNSMEE